MYQMPFIEFLPHRYLWYDLIDKLEIFSLFDADMQKMHAEIVKTADLVTYSGLKLIEFVAERKDARYLPNGVRIEDFTKATKGISDPKIAEILAKGKPVIGYYGALAEWVDLSLVRALAEVHAEWEFVLIGKAWVNISKLENLPNLHYFGPVPYTELPGYAIQFDVGIIPFAVNELTDCVSPIKLFEYCALGLPIITTPFYEVKQYQESFIKFANTVEEFSTAIAGCLDEKVKAAAKTEGLSFAQKNQWSTRIEKVEETIFQSWDGLRCLANYTPYHHLAVMAETFYHYDGRGFYAGGAERYLIDLENFFSKMNIKLVVYQYGAFPWMRKYQDVEVVSLAPEDHYLKDLTMEAVNNFNRNFFIANLKKSLINIYSPFYDNWPLALHPCIGVSHGISWDHYLSHYENGIRFWDANRGMIESSKTCDLLVSVDTNTANWFQTIDYETGQKIQYVPNYVDLEQFHPRQDYLAAREKVIILYPRRLYRARGLYLLLAVVDDILGAYPQVEFHFVGRGFEEDTRHVVKKQQKWGARLQWYALAPEEMPQVYQNADISLIPTLYSEGTSLACLEAMACGNAVIATRIGGLTNLVINEHNGVLIEPQAAALKAAIVSLLDDPDKLARLKQNGLEVAGAFSKRAWEQKWGKIIEDMLVENQPASPYEYSKTRLVDVYCDDPRNPAYINMLLAQLLQNNLLVYLRVKGNPSALIQSSYQRLQFLDWDEAIDAKPDLVIADASSARQLEQVDVILTGDLEQDVPSILSDL
jgi:glycosyltransferase involved in cell wall biosynthesis